MNGASQAGGLPLGGLDSWSFTGNAGDTVLVRMGTAGFNPELRLIGPNGALAGAVANGNGGGNDAELSVSITNRGVFTVVVNSYFDGGMGSYTATLAQIPGGFTESPGQSGGAPANGDKVLNVTALGGLSFGRWRRTPGTVSCFGMAVCRQILRHGSSCSARTGRCWPLGSTPRIP